MSLIIAFSLLALVFFISVFFLDPRNAVFPAVGCLFCLAIAGAMFLSEDYEKDAVDTQKIMKESVIAINEAEQNYFQEFGEYTDEKSELLTFDAKVNPGSDLSQAFIEEEQVDLSLQADKKTFLVKAERSFNEGTAYFSSAENGAQVNSCQTVYTDTLCENGSFE